MKRLKFVRIFCLLACYFLIIFTTIDKDTLHLYRHYFNSNYHPFVSVFAGKSHFRGTDNRFVSYIPFTPTGNLRKHLGTYTEINVGRVTL